MDIKSFLIRKGMTKAELCRKLGIDPKSSLVTSYEKGRSNPSFEICEKIIPLGITAQELFGQKLGDTLVGNSSIPFNIPPEFANDPEHAAGQNQGLKDIEAKIEARVLAKLKERGLAPIPPGSDNVHIDLQDPKFQELVEKALLRIEERKKQGIIK